MTDPSSELPITAVPDELVVHIPHLDVVKDWLARNGTPMASAITCDDRLNLALVGVAVNGPLEPLLRQMRCDFERDFAGWVPLVGKNRHVENVVGMPETKPHFASDPTDVPRPPSNPRTEGGRGVHVGMADSKLSAHPDLAGRFIADRSALLGPVTGAMPFRAGHATFVAGLVAGQAPAAELHVVDVLDEDGGGTVWELATRLIGLADAGLDVLNLSLGCRTEDNLPPLVLRRAVELLSPRMLVVASAGNHGVPPTMAEKHSSYVPVPTWPAALPGVVAVGATDDKGVAPYSPKVPWVTCVTRGTAVSTYLDLEKVQTIEKVKPFHGYARWQGTSFAAATVSGAIAAKTVPGKVTAHEALQGLLADPAGVVRKYVYAR